MASLESLDGEDDQRGQCNYVEDDVERVGLNAVTLGQEGVGSPEHLSVAFDALRVGSAEVGNPPGVELAQEEESVGEPEVCENPVWVAGAHVVDCDVQADGVWRRAD